MPPVLGFIGAAGSAVGSAVGAVGGALGGAAGAIGGALGGSALPTSALGAAVKGTVGGGLLGAAGDYLTARDAGKAQERAAQVAAGGYEEGARLIAEQQARTEESLRPFVTGEGGPASFQKQQALSGALGPEAQQAAYDEYVESPGVAFLRERGMRGIEQNAAAAGGLYSGNTMKALSEFNQGLALQDFNNYYNRLGSLTGVSLNAVQAQAGVGGQAASGQAQFQSAAGSELGAGILGKAKTYQSAYENIGSTLGNVYEAWRNRG